MTSPHRIPREGGGSRRSRFRLRAVLLDAYGTLFHFEPDRLLILFRSIVERLNVPIDSETLLQHWRVHEDAFRKSRVWLNDDGQWDAPPPEQFSTYRQAWIRAFESASEELNLDPAYIPVAADMIYDDLKGRGMFRDVPPALEALRARVPLAIVSNADHDFLHGTIQTNNLTFDHVIHSHGERVYKPHPRIFQKALDALSIEDPTQAIYVGDSPREDILGPQMAGIPAVWINRTGVDWPKEYGDGPDYEITNLLGLVDIVASKTLSAL